MTIRIAIVPGPMFDMDDTTDATVAEYRDLVAPPPHYTAARNGRALLQHEESDEYLNAGDVLIFCAPARCCGDRRP